MTRLPRTNADPALLDAARRVVWWMPPEETLRNGRYVNEHAMHGSTAARLYTRPPGDRIGKLNELQVSSI